MNIIYLHNVLIRFCIYFIVERVLRLQTDRYDDDWHFNLVVLNPEIIEEIKDKLIWTTDDITPNDDCIMRGSHYKIKTKGLI